MHHQDFCGDPPGSGSRKTVFHYRRGSGGGPPASSTASGVTGFEDNPSPAGASSPGPHQQPASQMTGAQVKKKSGFQITSVTSAQINVSGSNSLADDTESYDDLDESHTEDLSSSDMLDASVSRATDVGVPERSSSDETLNSLHGVDTPGLVSPNEPPYPHSSQGTQKHSAMVNGTVHPHYYPQQHSLPQQHHSDNLGAGESSLPCPPNAPTASSSQQLSKTGVNQSQRPPVLDSTQPVGGTTQPSAPIVGRTAGDAHLQGSGNFQNVSSVTPANPSGQQGFDNTSVSVSAATTAVGTGQSATAPATQTQTTTSSRFRVVKLDTNSEPFRKGRWTCTEFYEKEISPAPPVPEAPKTAESSTETEPNNAGVSPILPAVQPPHTLQPYQLPSQEYASPHAMQSPPQALGQTSPLVYVSPQEVVGTANNKMLGAPGSLPTTASQIGTSQPASLIPQQLPYTVDQQQAQAPGGYGAPQLSGLQPDFIQPTAPFQTQVQPPLAHVSASVSPGSAVTAKPLGSLAQPSLHQGHVAPSAIETSATVQQPSHPLQIASTASAPPAQGAAYMPLTALQADLQPLLSPGTALYPSPVAGGVSLKASQLEDAQKLLFQHQGLLGLPRLGAAAGGVMSADAGITARSLAHMGMSVEASALVAAAAGLRTQHVEGEDDSSSGASVVAIDNKIEQAMDLVKSHLMYAVREEVEVLKEQIKELMERNNQLEQENNLLKTLASPEQMAQFQAQVQTGGSPTGAALQPQVPGSGGTAQALPSAQNSGPSV
ncbi:TSC22 domain family protein 1 isoform X1 [Corythoichthys intestinalis]|uniref:TSC22 domain family protein 1 isoform X1 n=1 Tax=Corythoichthys intestinalis TaxID=161448 RepID=UPI0025A55253|nr:TSC22 domain family protein 1 isoform X1 [Corythoichthys intestinalis]XP_061802675.1 TSC22 domain family protein 1-like [Nerophis lumbriciformis]